MNIHETRSAVEYLDACLRDIAERGLAEEQEAFDAGLTLRDDLVKTIERHEQISKLASLPTHVEQPAGPQVIRKAEPTDVIEDRSATRTQLADALTRSVEGLVGPDQVDHVRKLAKRHGSDREWVRQMVVRSSDEYVSAFQKALAGRAWDFTPEEARAMNVSTNGDGGFAVPTHLDPTVILTNDSDGQDPIRAISRQVTLTQGNVWNGVTSAGSTASWDGELVEVSDDTATLARASVPLYSARAFIPASFEAFADIAGLADEVLMLLQDARVRLEATAHATGSGSSQPTGIFKAIDDGGNETVSTTAATIGLVDLHAVYEAVGGRYRPNAQWVMHPEWLNEIRELGTAVSASFTGDLRDAPTGVLLGRPVVVSDDAPNTKTTTALDQRIVFGDFSNYVCVDKPGSATVEFIPNLFSGTNGRPIAARGWMLFWRTGADSVNDAAFQLLMDKTSA
jgi:HK97 family phage major capsid protein